MSVNSKRFVVALLVGIVVFGFTSVFAQQTDSIVDEDPYNIRRQKFLSVNPGFQSWQVGDSLDLAQLSNYVNLYYQLTDQVVFTLKNAQARFRGENKVFNQDLADLSGLGDTQITVSYRLPAPDLILSAGVNLPTGTSELTGPPENPNEINTSALFSRTVFDFSVPVLGQGLNLTGGLSAAFPLGETMVFGVGAAYQMKGEFQPIAGDDRQYAPGDEIVFDVGFHVQLNETAVVGADFLYTVYGEDAFGGDPVYDAGDKLNAVVQYRQFFGFDELSLLARYRTKEPNAFALVAGQNLELEDINSNPDFFEAKAKYRIRNSDQLTTGILAEFKSYAATSDPFSDAQLFGFGLAPEVTVSDVIKIPIMLKYIFGDLGQQSLKGWQVGFGIVGFL